MSESLIQAYRLAEPVYITKPAMPDLKDYVEKLRGIWECKRLTNNGPMHVELERQLSTFLGVEHLSLFCNGTIALLVALKLQGIDDGEVITTPFTFPATTHALQWNGIRPVFCDLDSETLNMNTSRIERLITSETRAILPVHVFGMPCDVDAIEDIGRRHSLPVIYDAAHAFGVKYKRKPLVGYGDLSVLSFHATKLFSTVEGGAIVCHSDTQRKKVNLLKNFGISGEEAVEGPGINGKMNELQAAFGVAQLRMMEGEISARAAVAAVYRACLTDVPGITMFKDAVDTEPTNSYFPVRISSELFGMTRDELFTVLRRCNIVVRKYFYPLMSHVACYAALPSATPASLPVAERAVREVLCLPIYGDLDHGIVRHICRAIADCQSSTHRHLGAEAHAGVL